MKETKPMSHALERRNGRYSFAFTGDRNHIWHQLGQELPDDASRAQWIAASGFDYAVVKVPALADLRGPAFDHLEERLAPSEQVFLARADSGEILGCASQGYHVVQPADVWDWFDKYVTVDDRFHIDAAGVLHSGEKLWMTARFNGALDVAGDCHVPRLLMSTTFDCSQPTINQATVTRVVCQNTMRLAHSDQSAAIKTRHSTVFNGQAVAHELAQIAQSFANYKAMGDAMAQVEMTAKQVSDFFRQLLDIPPGARRADLSARKLNIGLELADCYRKTQNERNTNRDDAWTALQAVTRYVDHERATRNADNDVVGRFDSGTFGSGDALKGKAMDKLKALLPA